MLDGRGQGAGRLANVSGALLLGGASKQMGWDYAALEPGGTSFAGHIAGLLERLFEEVLLVGGSAPADTPGVRTADPPGPPCPLRGLVGALGAASAERVLVVASDLPLVTPELLLALTAWPECDAVVPHNALGRHPLCAIYRRDPVYEVARRRLEAGDLTLEALLDDVETGCLEGDDLASVDPDGLALTNVNEPADLARVRARLRPKGGF